MKENKHTPGEWKVDGNQSNAVVVDTGDTYPKLIAECGDERDAQLIASAKELLGALKKIIDPSNAILKLGDCTEHDAIFEEARQAIAKAKGTDEGEPSHDDSVTHGDNCGCKSFDDCPAR